MIKRHKIGLLFSETGTYAPLGRAMRAGAQLAVEEVNSDPNLLLRLEPVLKDPGGDLEQYYAAACELVAQTDTKHVVGCYTSSSRKEILPVFEKHDGLLWYPSHYEGFEFSENVVYTGAAPNQHVVPLLRYLLKHQGNRAWCLGSNYVWAWENNRIVRETLNSFDADVMAERYCKVDETDHRSMIDQIIADRPDFVFCTLIGRSLYTFLDAFRSACIAVGIDQAKEIPVASCSLSEAELPEIEVARDGHLSSSVYFSTVKTAANTSFAPKWKNRFGHFGKASADAEASYLAVHFLAQALNRAGTVDIGSVRDAVKGMTINAPQGQVTMDPQNLHCHMRPRIGVSKTDGSFEILVEEKEVLRPDPYLVWTRLAFDEVPLTLPNLRVVE